MAISRVCDLRRQKSLPKHIIHAWKSWANFIQYHFDIMMKLNLILTKNEMNLRSIDISLQHIDKINDSWFYFQYIYISRKPCVLFLFQLFMVRYSTKFGIFCTCLTFAKTWYPIKMKCKSILHSTLQRYDREHIFFI